ncbi:Coiled-coil domain-containing protein [Paragonimus heterotremus]|uniref:Coiled-coil domain-containing protein n=1 Tax=Paragonimus heterotremus TaxID=100268 RepID=A0A8J4WFR4_9TREM|nr:Coiled-coil domain-containing protein [Paragonimus heterotremus]
MDKSIFPSQSPPHIDLYNFENEQFATCRYILTSPRSLEACAKLNIKPIELLFKKKEDFAVSYRNFPQRKLDELYMQHENVRREKLMKARIERNNLIKKDGQINEGFARYSPQEDRRIENEPDEALSVDRKKQSLTLGPQSTPNSIEKRTPTTHTLPQKYESLLKKLPPNEAKRLKLAHQRCLAYAAQASRSRPSEVSEQTICSLMISGQKTRPQSSYRIQPGISSSERHTGDGPIRRCASNSSLVKESEFWLRRHAIESERIEETERLKSSLEDREKRAEQLVEKNERERQRGLEIAHYERERRLREAQNRRRELDSMLDSYRRDLQETREITQQKARERAFMRLSEELQRKVHERQQKEQHIKENAKQIQERQEEWRRTAEAIQKQKEEHVQKLLEEKELKIQESRNLALAAERLREEMLRVYNLDSFDKKAQRVALINELGLENTF